MLRASQYIDLCKHAIAGEPDSRLDLLTVVNQAQSFLVNMHDWKFRKRPPVDVLFQTASVPTAVVITTITRAANVVTVVASTVPVPPFVVGQTFIVAGVTDSSFDGSFELLTATDTGCTYAQTGSNGASSGGSIGAYAYEQFIDLPADFGELISVCTKNSTVNTIIPCSLEELAWRRGSPNATPYDAKYRCALSFPGQETIDDAQPGPRLELWPRPTTANPLGDLTITYRGGPVDLVYDADDFSDVTDSTPNLPPKFERLLVLLSRLFAQGYEEEVVQEDPIVQAEVAMLLEADGRVESNIGLLKGGAVQRRSQYQIREFSSVGNPANRLT